MPKERRDRSVSIDRSWTTPYVCSTSHSKRSLTKNPLENESVKEWEEARCPVCMEHPHNAILLLCSSHDKGCRPFMCDTSYRHSNCFDQFQKASSETQAMVGPQDGSPPVSPTQTTTVPGTLEGSTTPPMACETEEKLKLVCPLCRGQVNGWIVVEAARLFMNAKSRSCASESCEFSGTYTDLRKHARMVHPLVRPSEADPDRQRDWRRLERQRDIGDLLSTLQSSMGEERGEDSNSTSGLSLDEGGWLTVFFLIRVFRPRSSSRSSSWSGSSSRARAHVTIRRRPTTRLWGETHNDESRDDENVASDGGSGPRQRTRRQPAPDNDES